MAGINTHLLVITHSVNDSDFPIKRNRLADWIRKQDPCTGNISPSNIDTTLQ